jgi:hypothetical protein
VRSLTIMIKVHLEYNSKGYMAKCKPPAVPDVFLQTSSPAWLTGIPRRKPPDASSQDSPLNSRRQHKFSDLPMRTHNNTTTNTTPSPKCRNSVVHSIPQLLVIFLNRLKSPPPALGALLLSTKLESRRLLDRRPLSWLPSELLTVRLDSRLRRRSS